jgi:hypothetical protein
MLDRSIGMAVLPNSEYIIIRSFIIIKQSRGASYAVLFVGYFYVVIQTRVIWAGQSVLRMRQLCCCPRSKLWREERLFEGRRRIYNDVKWIFKKKDVKVQTGYSWLETESSVGIL